MGRLGHSCAAAGAVSAATAASSSDTLHSQLHALHSSPHSIFMPLALIGTPHRAISLCTNLVKYSGLRRSFGRHHDADALVALDHGRGVDGVAGRLGERSTIAFGVPLGNEKPPQAPQSRPFNPSSGAVGDVLQAGGALGSERDDRLHGAALDLRRRGRDLLRNEVEASGDQVLHCRPGAAVGDVGDLNAERHVDQDGAGVRAGAHAGRAVLHRFCIRLGVGHEFRPVVRRKILAHDQHAGGVVEQRRMIEVGDRVVERPRVELRHLRQHGAAREQQV